MAKPLPHHKLRYAPDTERRFARIGVGLLIGIVLIALLVRDVDLGEALRVAKLVSFDVLAAAVVLVLAGYMVRAWRWQLMLAGAGVKTGFGQATSVFFAAFAINNLLPLRAGDIYRCVMASRFHAGTITISLATLLTERLLDLGALTVTLGVLLIFFRQTSLELISLPISALLIFGVLVLASLIAFPASVRELVNTVAQKLYRGSLVLKIAAWIERFIVAIEGTLSRRALPTILSLTALGWLLELSSFVLIGSAVAETPFWKGGAAAGVFGTLATLVPGAPGHVGTFDFFAAKGFQSAGLSLERAVAAAVLCHIVVVVPVTLYGGLNLIMHREQ
jgi:uncharacterized protein (TIRG00374 family)